MAERMANKVKRMGLRSCVKHIDLKESKRQVELRLAGEKTAVLEREEEEKKTAEGEAVKRALTRDRSREQLNREIERLAKENDKLKREKAARDGAGDFPTRHATVRKGLATQNQARRATVAGPIQYYGKEYDFNSPYLR